MGTTREQVSGADAVEVPDATIWGWLSGRADRFGDDPAVAIHDGSGWSTRTWRQFVDDAHAIATGLIANGLEPGDRVVIMAPTTYDWTRVDLGTIVAGGVTVPVYETSTPDQCDAIVRQSRPRFALAATSKEADLLREIDPGLTVWLLDEGAADTLGNDGDEAAAEELARRLASVHEDTVATIVFTSGTTGAPKGVPLTQHQMVWTACQTAEHLRDALGPRESTLLFLPLAHIFARVVVFAALEAGVELAYGRGLEAVPEDLRSYRPTFLLAVPRMLERVVSGARQQATGWRRPVFDWAMRSARRWSEADHRGILLRARRLLADRLVLAQLRKGLGGRVRYAVSGGARLDPALAHTITGAGVPVLEGYGLTETTAPVSVNTPASNRIGTVGTPLPGVAIRLGDDNEIQIRAPSVMTGYLHDHDPEPGEGDDVFHDGWLRTGDQGEFTEEGDLVIVTRIKEILVTDGGKNIAPTPLEDGLTEDPAISSAMVVGDSRPYAAALVALDEDEAPPDEEERREHVQRVVDRVNEAVSTSESIREFRIISRPFVEDRDELTPTMKLRRERIMQHFADDIEALYSSGNRR